MQGRRFGYSRQPSWPADRQRRERLPAPSIRTKPRYQQLADELRTAIVSGTVPPDQFPTEAVLCDRYSVSRFTVREALRALQGEGLIQRRRGSGTVVRPATAREGALHQPLSNVSEILQYARDTRITFEPGSDGPLPRRLAEELRLPPTEPWVHFHGLRLREGHAEPIAFTDAWVHGSLTGFARQLDLERGAVFRQLEEMTGIKTAQVTQDIQAVPASKALAARLGIARRAPCLRLLRCYLDRAGVIREVSVSHHPGNRFAYAMHIDVED